MFSFTTSNSHLKNKTINITATKDNLSYIAKFGLPTNVVPYINSRLSSMISIMMTP